MEICFAEIELRNISIEYHNYKGRWWYKNEGKYFV